MNYVIGDSHVSIFSGNADGLSVGFPNKGDKLPNFRTGNVSARLAYNFGQRQSATAWHDHPVTVAVDHFLKGVPAGSPVIFSFGEIDCRCHVWDYALNRRSAYRSLWAVIDEIVHRYVEGLEAYKDRGVNAYVLLPHVIKKKEEGTIESAVGTWEQIREASQRFNEVMRTAWDGSRCISIFNRMCDEERYSDPDWYLDDTHLSQKNLPDMLEECKRVGLEI